MQAVKSIYCGMVHHYHSPKPDDAFGTSTDNLVIDMPDIVRLVVPCNREQVCESHKLDWFTAV